MPDPDELSTLLDRTIAAGVVPGAVAAVRCGDDLQLIAAGTTSFAGSTPMTPDAVFRIASMTKPIAAVVALQQITDGLYTLDEPIDRLVPELADRRVLRHPHAALDDTEPARRPVTVADLLDFRWGFGIDLDVFDTPVLAAAEDRGLAIAALELTALDADVWIARLAELPLMTQPGERWLYNTGSDVLGVLIARAAGRPLPEVFSERIFTPLGMVDTGFTVRPDQLDRLTDLYRDPPGDPDPADPTPPVLELAAASRWASPPSFPRASGGLVSTAPDYLRFATALRDGALLGPDALTAMTTDRLRPDQRGSMILDGRGWGLGVAVHRSGRYGWQGSFGTSWETDPATGTVAVLLVQRLLGGDAVPDLWTAFTAAAFT